MRFSFFFYELGLRGQALEKFSWNPTASSRSTTSIENDGLDLIPCWRNFFLKNIVKCAGHSEGISQSELYRKIGFI